MISVLAIDDSEDDLDLYRRLLKQAPEAHDVVTADTGAEGLELLRSRSIQCVLLDYHLTGDDGLAVLPAIREASPYSSVIMLSGNGSEVVAASAIKPGAADYLVKDDLSSFALSRSIESAVARAQLQAQLDQQRAEQEVFLRTLVHDIRAPLRHVMALTEAISEDFADSLPAGATEMFGAVGQAVQVAHELVDSLNEYALNDGAVIFEPVDLRRIAGSAVESLSEAIGERQAEIHIGELPVISGHAPQLLQLFQNLIGNGVKYNDDPTPRVSVAMTDREGPGCVIEFRDNGIGIPTDQVTNIFAPFRRLWTSSQYEGTGLGLAICKKVVDRHGGKIWCRSEPGRGTRFYVAFDRVETP